MGEHDRPPLNNTHPEGLIQTLRDIVEFEHPSHISQIPIPQIKIILAEIDLLASDNISAESLGEKRNDIVREMMIGSQCYEIEPSDDMHSELGFCRVVFKNDNTGKTALATHITREDKLIIIRSKDEG